MGVRSGFHYGEHRWLVSEPENWFGRRALTWAEYLEVAWSRQTESGLILGASIAGLMTIDFSSLPAALVAPATTPDANGFVAEMKAMRTRVDVANVWALVTHSATAEILKVGGTGGFRVTHQDLIHFNDSSEGFGSGMAGGADIPVIPGEGPIMPRGRFGVLPVSVLDRSAGLLDDAIACGEELLHLLSLLNYSLVACKDHDFDLAVVTSWSVCERIVGRELTRYANARAEAESLPVNGDRRRSWDAINAATATEVLALAGVITPELDERLTKARRARNAWIHRGVRPDYGLAVDAVQLAADLIDLSFGIRLAVTPAVGVVGLGN